jgi:hypothetical protein
MASMPLAPGRQGGPYACWGSTRRTVDSRSIDRSNEQSGMTALADWESIALNGRVV